MTWQKTKAELKELYAVSASVGALLQQSRVSPADACVILLITLGRLVAREGFSDLTVEAAWASVINDDTKVFFKWGHDEERAGGRTGAPRRN